MPLIPDDDPERLAEFLGYLGEIGYGELYLGRQPGAVAPAGQAQVAEPEQPGEPVKLAEPEQPDQPEGGTADEGGGPLAGRAAAGVAREGSGGDDPAARAAALVAVAEVVAACRRCRLCEGRQKTVFGSGDPNADLMFIGEGPGAEEDRQGLPFVGRAGELLTRIIEAIGMTRDQVYIANIVKCRPPGNRDPQPDEVAACRSYLERQIALVRPRLLVALGRIAAQALLGNDLPIGRMRGQWFTVLGVPLMVTYHPAALLRNPALKRPTWEDMQQVRDRLRGEGVPP
jgi:uracil-DNA glycosylase family 4